MPKYRGLVETYFDTRQEFYEYVCKLCNPGMHILCLGGMVDLINHLESKHKGSLAAWLRSRGAQREVLAGSVRQHKMGVGA